MMGNYCYVLLFKSPTEQQIERIRNVFSDYDWSAGFAVEEIENDELINNYLVIKFISRKSFFIHNKNEFILDAAVVESVLTGKGQFLGHLYSLEEGIEKLDSYFFYQPDEVFENDQKIEIGYKIEYGKYSKLIEISDCNSPILNYLIK